MRTREVHELQAQSVAKHEAYVKLQNDYNDLCRLKMEMQNNIDKFKNMAIMERREES